MKKHIALLFALIPLVVQAGFGGMGNVEYDGASASTGGGIFFVLLGAAAGFIWSEFKGYQVLFGVVVGSVAGLVAQLILT